MKKLTEKEKGKKISLAELSADFEFLSIPFSSGFTGERLILEDRVMRLSMPPLHRAGPLPLRGISQSNKTFSIFQKDGKGPHQLTTQNYGVLSTDHFSNTFPSSEARI